MTQYNKKVHNEQNSVQNIEKIRGNTDFVKVVFPKVSFQFSGIWYNWKGLLDIAKISFFLEVGKMSILLYWVAYCTAYSYDIKGYQRRYCQ